MLANRWFPFGVLLSLCLGEIAMGEEQRIVLVFPSGVAAVRLVKQ